MPATNPSRELMEAPEKPKIDSIYYPPQQDPAFNFEYEETDQSYHRGNLFMFEESSNNFER